MTNLTEQFKQGKLEEYKRYYCRTVWFEDIFMARCHNKGQNDEWWTLENEKYSYNNVHHIKDIEVLAEVPSYEELQKLLSDQLAKNDGVEINAELEKSVKDLKHRNENLRLALKTYELPEIQKVLIDWRTGELDRKFNKLAAQNTKLKELLKECRDEIDYLRKHYKGNIDHFKNNTRLDKEINQVLGEE